MMTLTLFLSSISFAYAADDYWATNPKYYIDDLPSAYRTSCSGSISDWNSALRSVGAPISLQFSTITSANVIVDADYYGNVSWVGRCVSSANSSNDQFISASVSMNRTKCDSYVANKKRSVACHEFGHVLGLKDYSTQSRRIMYRYIDYVYDQQGMYTPQSADRTALSSLY